MRYFIFFLWTLLFISCSNSENQPTKKTPVVTKRPGAKDSSEAVGTIRWIDDFKNFREAVYQGQRLKVKTYFDFPVQNEHNELWWLVTAPGESEQDISKPFTEKDFDKGYDKIFTREFIKALLKLKSADLYANGEAESIGLKEGATSYKVYAGFDKDSKTLTLNLAFNTATEEEGGEYNVIYTFSILPSGRLKFKQLNLAG